MQTCVCFFFFSSRRRHTRYWRDWSSDVCSSDLEVARRIARLADGNWLKALAALEAGSENRQFLDMFIMLMRLAYQRDIKSLKKWSEVVAGYGGGKSRRMVVYLASRARWKF